jgi:hypothetical protein
MGARGDIGGGGPFDPLDAAWRGTSLSPSPPPKPDDVARGKGGAERDGADDKSTSCMGIGGRDCGPE